MQNLQLPVMAECNIFGKMNVANLIFCFVDVLHLT